MSRRSNAGSQSRSGRSPSYCSNCGEELAASMNFCPNCGANCEKMYRPQSRGTSVSDRDVLEYRIFKAVEAGWELEHDFGDRAVMVRRDFGSAGMHVLILLFTIWWTMGVGNALYAMYRYFGAADRMVLRADHVDTSDVRSSGQETDDSSIGSLGIALLCWLGMVIALAIATSTASPVWMGVFTGASIGLGLIGFGVLPPIRRRLENRHSLTTNGWTRSVRERSVTDPDRPCMNCAGPIDHGVERTYQKELTLLGVPLTTDRGGTNYYCRRCANAEFDVSRSGSSPTRYRSARQTPESESIPGSNLNDAAVTDEPDDVDGSDGIDEPDSADASDPIDETGGSGEIDGTDEPAFDRE